MNEKIKNYLGIVVVAVLLIFSFAAISYVNTYSKSIEPAAYRSFSVSAEGKITALPDVAQFTFKVITEGGKNISDLQKENTEGTNKIIEFIKSENVAAKDIKTQNYNLEPRYQYYSCPKQGGPCPPPDIVGYTITQTILVKIRDFQKIGDILSGVVQNGANDISQLSFTIDDPTAVQDQARNEAITKAKEKALAVTQAGGFKIGRLLSIEEGYTPYYKYETMKAMGGENAPLAAVPTIEPGSQEITVTMTLRYEIK
jgi:hypothetical protein